jgi:hypothetical protein
MKKIIFLIPIFLFLTYCGPSTSEACENIWDVCAADLAAQGVTGAYTDEDGFKENCEEGLSDDSDEKVECYIDAQSCDDWYACG